MTKHVRASKGILHFNRNDLGAGIPYNRGLHASIKRNEGSTSDNII
jgi:hypothetical protein